MSSPNPSAKTDARSQAQSVLPDSKKSPEDAVNSASGYSGEDAEVQHFDTTIVKINADGVEVMSDHVGPGETLRRATTERYALSKSDKRAEANEEQSK